MRREKPIRRDPNELEEQGPFFHALALAGPCVALCEAADFDEIV